MRQPDSDVGDAVQQVSRINTVPILLQMVSEMTGLGLVGISRVTESSWTACAVYDAIEFGLQVGRQLNSEHTFCANVSESRRPVVIDDASADVVFRDHRAPKIYGFQSIISVPIVRTNGYCFGALFGLDREPRAVSDPWVLTLFNRVANLIALQLDTSQPSAHELPGLRGDMQMAELRKQFMGALAEELRRPVAAICDAADQLETKSADASAKALAGCVKRRVRRIGALADHMSDFTRGSSGMRLAIRVEESVDLDSLLTRILADIRLTHPHRKIISNIAIGRACRCDPARIAQLILNLLDSALDQAGPGGPVSISATFEESNLSIDVWNSGAPIPSEHLAQVFAAGWRPDAASRPIDSLSLHVCRLIVDAHDGSILATSNKKEGTQFSVRVPQATAAPRRRMVQTSGGRHSY